MNKKISFNELKAEFLRASNIMGPYHSPLIGFVHIFSAEFTMITIKRAWEDLDRAKKFVGKLRLEYPFGQGRDVVDRLSKLITEAYCKITIETSTTGTTKRITADDNDGFIF